MPNKEFSKMSNVAMAGFMPNPMVSVLSEKLIRPLSLAVV
jgi:hypothetical protein